MAKVKSYRTGKDYNRKRPTKTFTLSPQLAKEIETLADEKGFSQSQLAERLLLLGLGEYKKQRKQHEQSQRKETKPVNNDFGRKIMLDGLDNKPTEFQWEEI